MSIRDEYIQARIAEIQGSPVRAKAASKQVSRELRAETRKSKCTGIWRKA